MLGNRIKQARLAKDVSLRGLGHRVGRSGEMIRKYEGGESEPTAEMLRSIASALETPLSFFVRATRLEDLSAPAFRTEAHQLKSNIEPHIRARVAERLERYLDVVSLAGERVGGPLPRGFPIRVSNLDEVDAAADKLRKAWNLGLDEILILVELLENNGIPVVELEDPPCEALCFAFRSDIGNGFVVGLKKGVVGDRQRFSVAHELGHIMLEFDGMDPEEGANRFAGAFLVPNVAVEAELGQNRRSIALDELYPLKHKWGLSMQAWLYRCVEVGMMSEHQRKSLRQKLDALNSPVEEPGSQIAFEVPTRMDQLLRRLIAEELISESRAAELAGVRLREWRTRKSSSNLMRYVADRRKRLD